MIYGPLILDDIVVYVAWPYSKFFNMVEEVSNSLNGFRTKFFPVEWGPLINPHGSATVHHLDAPFDITYCDNIYLVRAPAIFD